MTVEELLAAYTSGQRDFSGITIHKARLIDVDLRDINLSGAKLTRAKLIAANLDGANLRDTQTNNSPAKLALR
ncbi:MAG: pentapeptide repeat-containing protein [Cyanobacteria bacterium J06650_10]